MSKNSVQFQSGYSLPELFNTYGLKSNAGKLYLIGNGQKVSLKKSEKKGQF